MDDNKLDVEKTLCVLLSEQDKTNDKIRLLCEVFEKIERVLECSRNKYGRIDGIRDSLDSTKR